MSSGHVPFFDGTHYAAWRYKIKIHLISLHPSIWKIVCTGFDLPDEDQELTSNEEQNMYHNAQATSVLLSALSPEEFNKVDGLEEAKQIWGTLQVAHEVTTSVRESKIELLLGKLGRFVLEDHETPQARPPS